MLILMQSPRETCPSFCSKLITDPDRTGIKETWRCNHIHGLKCFFTRKNGQPFQPKKKQTNKSPKNPREMALLFFLFAGWKIVWKSQAMICGVVAGFFFIFALSILLGCSNPKPLRINVWPCGNWLAGSQILTMGGSDQWTPPFNLKVESEKNTETYPPWN